MAVSNASPAHAGSGFQINAGLNDAWVNAGAPFQGLFITVYPELGIIYIGWFAFDTEIMPGLPPAFFGASDQRWATAVGRYSGHRAELKMELTTGGLFNQAVPLAVQNTAYGTLVIEFLSCSEAQITFDVPLAGQSGNFTIRRVLEDNVVLCDELSVPDDPQPGLATLPQSIDPDIPIAITDVCVVPLSEPGKLLLNQTLVIENGIISAVGPFNEVQIPEGASVIDGRGLFVGPGLADMHTHLTASGQPAMNESGLLFIANGVTTVLNMGDGGTLNLPGIDALFASGQLIGPTVYAGKDAYGTSDGRGSLQTVTTRGEAINFANRAFSEGYQYIKVYNGLSWAVVDQFRLESQRLGLPVIGHIPKTMSMQNALDLGQSMVAHTAEVYFTYFGNQPDPAFLQGAADLLISKGVYLTDTLTASESFADMFGGNTANYNAYLQRDGVQYIPQSMINGWTNFFNSNTLQPPGSQPGQLDARLAFFKQMNRFFADAGVKMIMGTDSPGAHTGLVAGFAVQEELRLLDEIGLTPEQIYIMSAATPGEFISTTLGLDISFGTLEVGERADVLLMAGNPLEDFENLKRPAAVISRGRMWSQTYLQQQLDLLEAKYNP